MESIYQWFNEITCINVELVIIQERIGRQQVEQEFALLTDRSYTKIILTFYSTHFTIAQSNITQGLFFKKISMIASGL